MQLKTREPQMSDLRQDPVTGRWVIIAENRANRPIELQRIPTRRLESRCPFCAGNEQDTPPAVANYSLSNGVEPDNWQVRVVPNKFPALRVDQKATQPSAGLFNRVQSPGVHEVIVESPNHLVSVTELTEDQFSLVHTVYRDRLRDLSELAYLAYPMIFRNAGAAAGASLEHLHSQLMALAIVPLDVQVELDGSKRFLQRNGNCVCCSIVSSELEINERVIAHSPRFVALCPFASRFPYETWILPRQHASHFEDCLDDELRELSGLVHQSIGRIEQALDNPAYNVLLRSGPFDRSEEDHYHWRIEILPRLSEIAGFEFGTGCFVNCVSPERAAVILRETAPGNPEPKKA